MADNLGSLYFTLGLEDKDFKTKMDAIVKQYGSLITQVDKNSIASSKYRKALIDEEWAQQRTRKTTAQAEAAEVRLAAAKDKVARAATRMSASVGSTNKGLSSSIRLSGELKNQLGGVFGIYTIERFGKKMAEITGQFELQKVSLRAILGDAPVADKIFEQIKSLAVQSPFQFMDLASYTKQLAAFSVPASDLFGTMKKLADVSSGLGVDMSRIVLAFGQVKAASVLRGQELRQFTEAGIPLVDMLAQKFSKLKGETVSTGDVFSMISKRMVSFADVSSLFDEMTSKGGKFYNMQEIQAATLAGRMSNLKDAFQIGLSDMGSSMDGFLKGSVDALTSVGRNMETLGKIVVSLVAIYGTYKAAVIAVNIVSKLQTEIAFQQILANIGNAGATIQLSTAQGLAAVASSNLSKAMLFLNKTMLANPYVLVATLIVGVASAMWVMHDSTTAQEYAQKSLNKINEDSTKKNEDLKSNITGLISTIQSQTASIYEQVAAYEKLKSVAPSMVGGKTFQEVKTSGITQAQIGSEVSAQGLKAVNAELEKYVDLLKKYNEQNVEGASSFESLKLKKSITDVYSSAGVDISKKSFEAIGAIIESTVSGLRSQRDELIRIRDEAEFEAKPLEEKKKILNEQLDSLKQQEIQLSSVLMLSSGYTADLGDVKTQGMDGVLAATKNVNSEWKYFGSLTDVNAFKLSGVREEYEKKWTMLSGLATPTNTKEHWEQIKKDAEDALALVTQFDFAGRKKQQDIIDNAKKNLEFWETPAKTETRENKAAAAREKRQKAEAAQLQKRIDLIKEAYGEYEKLQSVMTKPQAKAAVEGFSRYKGTTIEEGGIGADISAAVAKYPKNKFTKEIARKEGEEAAKSFSDGVVENIKNIFDSIKNEIDTYKSRFDFYKELIGGGISKEDAINISFGTEFDGKVMSVDDFIKSELQKAGKAVKDNPIDLSVDMSSTVPLQKQLDKVYAGLPSDIKAMIDEAEKYRIDKQKEGYSEYLKIISEDIPEGSGFTFLASGATAKMTNDIRDIQARAEKAMLSVGDEQDKQIIAWRDNSINAEKEVYDQKLKSIGSEYIERTLKNKMLWEDYSNMSKGSLANVNRIFKELEAMQKDLLSGRKTKDTFASVGAKGGAFTDILSGLSGAESIGDFQDRITSLYDEIGRYNDETITQSGRLGRLNADQVESLKAALKLLRSMGIAIANSKNETEKVKFEKLSEDAKNVATGVIDMKNNIKGLAEAFGAEFDEVDEAALNLVDVLANTTSQTITSITTAAATANAAIVTAAEASDSGIKATSAAATTAIKAVETASVILAVISAAIQIATAIVNIFTASSKKRKKEAEEERLSVLKVREAYLEAYADISNKKFESIFGDDAYGKAKGQIELIRKTSEAFNLSFQSIVDKWGRHNTEWIKLFGSEKETITEIMRGSWGWGQQTIEVDRMLDVTLDNFDIVADRAALAGKDLDEGARTSLQTLVDLYDDYQEYLESISEYLSGIFGGIGDDLMESIVSNLDNSKNAIDDFTDYVGDSMWKMAQDMAKSLYLAPVFAKMQDDIKNAMIDYDSNDEQQMIDIFAKYKGETDAAIVSSSDFLANWKKSLEAVGYTVGSTTASSGLKNGIEGITEDTASRLVGYMNTVRADVSVTRKAAEAFQSCVSGGMMKIDNSRVEAQMLAMNGKIAEATLLVKSIDDRIASVITQGTDGKAFRVK